MSDSSRGRHLLEVGEQVTHVGFLRSRLHCFEQMYKVVERCFVEQQRFSILEEPLGTLPSVSDEEQKG